MTHAMRATLLLFALGLLGGCSTEALDAPQPSMFTPGAFTAVDEENGTLTLYRTLDYLELETDTLLFLTEYEATPRTYDEARESAKRHDLPVRVASVGASAALFPGHPYQVVWFRTLTDEEKARGE